MPLYRYNLNALVAIALALSLPGSPPAQAREPGKVDFEKQIWPILFAQCFRCHGPDRQEGQLRLDARSIVLRGGVSGPTVVPGEPEKSPLYRRIRSSDPDQRMPLDEDPIPIEQAELLKRWIREGADWPSDVGVAIQPASAHWAYQSIARPEVPTPKRAAWPRNALDAFVLARLEASGRTPAAPADRRRLIRRVYLDLVGIPPGVDEVERYANSTDPRAYEQIVDRLLASPRYGERWARPWLDLARYADSNGYQADQYRNVWPYRDWVIDALNHDMPFDQFTIEQLAGDLLPNSTVRQKVATGFHRLTTCNVEAGVDPEANRVNQVFDRVNTTGTVWLGTTVICMQCHNHKYDPLTQPEYYQLFAFFNNTPLEVEGDGVTYNFTGPKMNLPLAPADQQQQDRLIAERKRLQLERDARAAGLEDRRDNWEARLIAGLDQQPRWHPLKVVEFKSEGGASHQLLEDRSVLVSGKKPDRDTYQLILQGLDRPLTGFKIETLTDPSLPGGGPGRHHPDRPNFILSELSICARSPDVDAALEATPLGLRSATADFSQQRWDVAGILDGDPATGWGINPQFGKPHFATVILDEPSGGNGWHFEVTLLQNHGEGRTIGRLRIAAMTEIPGTLLPKPIRTILAKPAGQRSKAEADKLTAHYHQQDKTLVRLERQIATVENEIAAIQPTTTLVMVEQAEPRETHVFGRGDFKDPLEKVAPGTPDVFPTFSASLPASRLGLARWLVDKQNPLTARVTVNRWWAEVFGRGIVATEEDFGTQGDRPSHPELLDWLAWEFIESGWSMKHIHRLIVTSATYRQSSDLTAQGLDEDPANVLLGRGPRFRLSAESIRDNALAISGLLDQQMHGPPVYPPQPDGIWRHVGRNAPVYRTSTDGDRFRRGIYVVWRRSAPYPSFTNFDAPDRASCVVQRSRTNTPMQALTLLNDAAYVEIAQHLAQRIERMANPASEREKMTMAFQLVAARKPTKRELDLLLEYFHSRLDYLQQHPEEASDILTAIQVAEKDRPRLAAWFFVANVLLNLDETITKG